MNRTIRPACFKRMRNKVNAEIILTKELFYKKKKK